MQWIQRVLVILSLWSNTEQSVRGPTRKTAHARNAWRAESRCERNFTSGTGANDVSEHTLLLATQVHLNNDGRAARRSILFDWGRRAPHRNVPIKIGAPSSDNANKINLASAVWCENRMHDTEWPPPTSAESTFRLRLCGNRDLGLIAVYHVGSLTGLAH